MAEGSVTERAASSLAVALVSASLCCAACGSTGPTSVDAGNPALRSLVGGDASVQIIGTTASPNQLNNAMYASTVAREFNSITPENHMKWALIHPQQNTWDFTGADQIVAFAQSHRMAVRGHTLVWHEQLPNWVMAVPTTEFERMFVDHIRTEVAHYRGQVTRWDVVNEPIADDGTGLRSTIFLERLGPRFIELAFRTAHEADPAAELYLNEFGAEGSGAKADRLYATVQGLVAAGVPIHGVGLQMHIDTEYRVPWNDLAPVVGTRTPPEIAANIARLSALGLRVQITEMDVALGSLPETDPTRFTAQRAAYHDVVAACAQHRACTGITIWGLNDSASWLDRALFGPQFALLYDDMFAPKPAYFGVQAALAGRP
jgi:endo-1,4-beta-xylanase